MKLTFYVYWVWYICATLFLLSDIELTQFQAQMFTAIHYLSQSFLVIIPISIIFIYQIRHDKVDMKYLEGCLISFILRSMLTVASIFGMQDRWLFLALCTMIIGLWYIFNLEKIFKKL
jgi:hypothetical protein